VTTGVLASEADIDRKTAAATLKSLQQQGILEWHDNSAKDPSQFYALTAY
jgi:DNA-binding HxlR family transcriptional regulator